MKGEKVLVVGSMNMDLVFKTARFPRTGETVSGEEYHRFPGGKGANQAVAAARLGGDVAFVGACGCDEYGDYLLSHLVDEGIATRGVLRVADDTGVAAISVDARGDNRIIVIPGANSKLDLTSVSGLEDLLGQSSVLLMQLEIPLDTVRETIDLAAQYDVTVVLDPAPAQELPAGLYSVLDYLLPNEVELNQLNPACKAASEEERIEDLLERGVEAVIVTRGEQGATLCRKDGRCDVPAPRVQAVDTTAAGDALAGALAMGLAGGWDEERALRFAVQAASISVTRMGAQSSLPRRWELDDKG